MTNFDMVERLRAKANVSYEEAKAALEASDWDLLEAMVLLEREGKVKDAVGADYSTKETPPQEEARPNHTHDRARRLGRKLISAVNYLCSNSFEIIRAGSTLISVPVLVVALCVIIFRWYALIALIVGLFFGLRYSFVGPDVKKNTLNDAMDKAADVVEDIKDDFKSNAHDRRD